MIHHIEHYFLPISGCAEFVGRSGAFNPLLLYILRYKTHGIQTLTPVDSLDVMVFLIYHLSRQTAVDISC